MTKIICRWMAIWCLGMFLTVPQVFAEGIATVHGHSGHIEFQDRVQSDRQHLGWGLDFQQKSGFYNWVHFSIPVPWGSKVQFVGFMFETGSADAFISRVDVYDGGDKIYQQNGLTLSGDKRWHVIDMGEEFTIDEALGISIQTATGVEMMSHQFIFYTAGAQWQ